MQSFLNYIILYIVIQKGVCVCVVLQLISHIIIHTHTHTHMYVCVNIDASRVKAFVDRINVVATFGNVFARRRMQISVYTLLYIIYT